MSILHYAIPEVKPCIQIVLYLHAIISPTGCVQVISCIFESQHSLAFESCLDFSSFLGLKVRLFIQSAIEVHILP